MGKKSKNDVFIKKAIEVHGNKYDYSLVEYKHNQTNVEIVCNDCGYKFLRTPHYHLKRNINNGCKNCYSLARILTTDIFIEKAIEVHGNKYDYSLVKYEKSKTKIKIICPIHGEFEQIPNSHLSGHGCDKCGSFSTTYNFIITAKEIHCGKYDYSLVNYIDNKTKVKIICPTHGIFEQTPGGHLFGRGCEKCAFDGRRILLEDFIKRSKKIHNDKYDYSLVEYCYSTEKVKIICPTHGIFEQTPSGHLVGKGCSKCKFDKHRLSTDEFIKRSKKIHEDKYDYSLIDYIDVHNKVKIVCPTHGIFEQKANSHLHNHGCPYCNESFGEKKINSFLKNKKISYIREFSFDDCVGKNNVKLRFDFYLIKYNICIEFDGKQHFIAPEQWGGDEYLLHSKKLDKIKNEYCKNNNIHLLRIKYTKINYIDIILSRLLKLL